jgi:GntR family transcriptional repressor for pyruvate dehydrogenase complex
LAEKLQGGIDSGDYAIGSSLPSERELMLRHRVSRTTVREALRMLGAQGLLEVRRGRSGGSFVSMPTANSVQRSLELFIKGQSIRFIDLVFARHAIEPAAAAQAAFSRSEEQLQEIERICADCERVVGDIAAFVTANLAWHRAVVRASNNPLFITFLASISDAMQAATDLDVFDLKARKAVVAVHWQIFDAIRLRNQAAARRRMERHLCAYSETLSSADLATTRT